MPVAEPTIPPALQRTVNVLRMNITQAGILHVLAQHPDGATIADLTTELSLRSTTIHRHLDSLEADGLIRTDQPEGVPRRGKTVRYFSDAQRIQAQLDQLASHIVPPRRS